MPQDAQRGHLIDAPWRSRRLLKQRLRQCVTVLQIAWRHGPGLKAQRG
jgi:hypothetical protein